MSLLKSNKVPESTLLSIAPTISLNSNSATIPIFKKSGRIDLSTFLNELANREHSSVLFECGATLAGALVEEKLFDEIILYIAPKFLGNNAKSLLMLPELARMSDYERLEIKDVRKIGDDIRVILSSTDKRAKDD